MKIAQNLWSGPSGWHPGLPARPAGAVQLVLLFAGTTVALDGRVIAELQRAYPQALVLGCTTAGEIAGTRVHDDTAVATAVEFGHTDIHGACVEVNGAADSFGAGKRLARSLPREGLVHVFVLSDGLHVNGSDLVRGLTEHLPAGVIVTGGLSGDGERFARTGVIWKGEAREKSVAAVGLYGERLRVGYGSLGGWDPFGPERLITRSDHNVLYEMDGRSALELYKTYLGEHAHGLPATGLLFPLSLRRQNEERGVVRTILAVDEEHQSMTFAGDVPEGSYARLMKANFNRLIDGAMGAARTSYQAIGSVSPDLAILISCVGRKMVLKQRVEEEVESVREVLGERAILTGFYSYGEISPFTPDAKCELHNQTMTITTFSEV